MIRREILGLYGPNRPSWRDADYEALVRSKVSWVVWRLDADPSAPKALAAMGIQPIAQALDRFSGAAWLDPARQATSDYEVVQRTCPPGTPFVPDNEPNLNPLRAGNWYAEQWTRYLRAYMAVWRWLDAAGAYPLVTPALAVGPDRNGELWLDIGAENLSEANGQGMHAYWQNEVSIQNPHFGAPWELGRRRLVVPKHYVIEYANTLPDLTHADTLDQYETFLRGLPAHVRCACLFGLNLTPDWDRFAVSEPVLDWLAGLS